MEDGYAIYKGKKLLMFFSFASKETVQGIAKTYEARGHGNLEVKKVKISVSVVEE